MPLIITRAIKRPSSRDGVSIGGLTAAKRSGPEATLTATQRRPVNGRRRDASPSIRFADCALRDSNDDKRYDRRGN